MRRTITAAAAAAGLMMLAAGCSSPAKPQITAAQAARARAAAAGRALDPGRTQPPARPVPTVRLGVMASGADPAALAAAGLGLYARQLSDAGIALQIIPYTSGQAEADALAAGTLDAAYISPDGAVQAWQRTRGKIRIVSGTAARTSAGGQPPATTAVLTVTTGFLSAHLSWFAGLLAAQVQVTSLMVTDPASGNAAARAELAALLHRRLTARALASAFAGITTTSDPGIASILAQARAAATARTIQPIGSLAALYDLGPLNQLLKAADLPAVTM